MTTIRHSRFITCGPTDAECACGWRRAERGQYYAIRVASHHALTCPLLAAERAGGLLFAFWTNEHAAAASVEGWDLFEADGSIWGPIQVQRFDAPLPHHAALDDDIEAWTIVRRGTLPHHVAARLILAWENPTELHRLNAWEPAWDGKEW